MWVDYPHPAFSHSITGVLLLTIVDDLPKFGLAAMEGNRGSFSGVPLLCIYYLALLLTISCCTINYSLFVHLDRKASGNAPLPGYLKPLLVRTKRVPEPALSLTQWSEAKENGQPHSHHANGDANPQPTPPPAKKPNEAKLTGLRRDWELVIQRLEVITLVGYVTLVAIFLLAFFFPFWR